MWKREATRRLADQHAAHIMCAFGPVARMEAGPTSDIDLVVDVQPWVVLEFLGLWDELEDSPGTQGRSPD